MQILKTESARPVLCFRSPTPDVTRAAGHALAGVLDERGLTLALSGALGTGKTLFVKGLAQGLGLDPDCIASPTFGIAHQHPLSGGRLLAHIDLYRLDRAAEIEMAGLLDLLEPGAVVAVEWADRFPEAFAVDRLELRLRRAEDPQGRWCEVSARGAISGQILPRWAERLATGVGVDFG